MRILAGIFLLLAFGLMPVSASAEFTKTKIAVLDFQMQGEEQENQDMGSIVAEWFITAMVKEGRFDVIERRLLQKILSEQQLVMTGVVDESSATQIGKLLGVKVIISGSVMKVREMLEVNARIIDVENASIIAAESVKSSTASRLQDLIVEMSAKIIRNFPLEGYVVDRDGKKVTLDLGSRSGVKPGMEFVVYREGEVIKHPKTGEVLDVERIHTGRVRIQTVLGKISEGEVLDEEADDAIKYGQLVSSAVIGGNGGRRQPATAAAASVKPAEDLPKGRLYVSSEPSGAKIRILNIGPVYREGMELAGGSYHIEVSAPGYRTDRQWLKLAAGEDRRVAVSLRPAPVEVSPPPTALVPKSQTPQARATAQPPTVAAKASAAKGESRYIKMLRSGNLRSKTDAGKLIVREGVKDTAVLDVVEQELLKGYQASGDDRGAVDAMAWLCKALGASGNGKYRSTLRTVAQKAPHRKLQKYAEQSLGQLR
ncbi:FlgO family outer membrane protein [Desulfuromonas acetexigens]|uniref:PEGA domain-containing protein n=1 Tax=Trichloromonas acetexigens TaxID=38815 RepID=A0A550JF80_9BACT|nr:FlgO family outer membrane protein [Desulfuromonas acetexigens]TRO81877.1 PEGA domain-containing protein [Desulfuromonas acetexigens]